MKKLIDYLFLALFIFVACNDDNTILEPINLDNQTTIEKSSEYKSDFTDNSGLNNISNTINGNWSQTDPQNGKTSARNFQLKTKYTKNYFVDGNKGAVLFVKNLWRTKKGEKIKLDAKLTIPKGAYNGVLKFDMIFDLENYALELYPSPFTFDIPVILDMDFINVDMSNMNPAEYNFTYLDGEEIMEYKNINLDVERGVLSVKGAILHHFSRYGWTRTGK